MPVASRFQQYKQTSPSSRSGDKRDRSREQSHRQEFKTHCTIRTLVRFLIDILISGVFSFPFFVALHATTSMPWHDGLSDS